MSYHSFEIFLLNASKEGWFTGVTDLDWLKDGAVGCEFYDFVCFASLDVVSWQFFVIWVF